MRAAELTKQAIHMSGQQWQRDLPQSRGRVIYRPPHTVTASQSIHYYALHSVASLTAM